MTPSPELLALVDAVAAPTYDPVPDGCTCPRCKARVALLDRLAVLERDAAMVKDAAMREGAG